MSPKRFLAVLGSPIAHSKSAHIMNALLKKQRRPYTYLAIDVKKRDLESAVQSMRALNFYGFNVTLPHKVGVINYLDFISEDAKKIGAVNTVINHKGKLRGYNTDGPGYLLSLHEAQKLDYIKQRVVILGSGGTAKSIAWSLLKEGVQSLLIASRNLQSAEQLTRDLNKYGNCKFRDIGQCRDDVTRATLVINTTPVGMYPFVDEAPIPLYWLHKDLVVSDVIYNPQDTLLLRGARACGARTVSGLGMFLAQASLSYRIWFGSQPSISMVNEVYEL